jgi:hypothetical protein
MHAYIKDTQYSFELIGAFFATDCIAGACMFSTASASKSVFKASAAFATLGPQLIHVQQLMYMYTSIHVLRNSLHVLRNSLHVKVRECIRSQTQNKGTHLPICQSVYLF